MAEATTSNPANRGVSYLYMAAAFVIVVAGMRAAESILNPLLLAIFLSVISAPAYFGLLKRGVSNWLALLIVIGVLSIVVLGVAYVVMDSIGRFTSQQDHYRGLIEERTEDIKRKFRGWVPEWAREKPAARPVAVDDGPTDEADAETESAPSASGDSTDENTDAQTTASKPAESGEAQDSDGVADAQRGDESGNVADVETDDAELPSDGTLGEEGDESNLSSLNSEINTRLRPAIGPTFFPTPQDELPNNEQSWREYWSEQFSLGTAISLAVNIVERIGQLLGNTFLILLMVIFILLEASTFTKKMRDAFTRTDDMAKRAQQIVNSIQHYIVIKTWVSLATGILVVIWLKFLGVNYAPLWGLLAFLFNYIPNVGSFIAAIPAILIAWIELTTLPAIACAIGFILVNGAVGNFIEPRLMGRGLGLSPLVVFCSMVFWGWVLGPVGMLLSVPLTMTARIAMDGFEDTKWLATLMGNADS